MIPADELARYLATLLILSALLNTALAGVLLLAVRAYRDALDGTPDDELAGYLDAASLRLRRLKERP